MEIRKSEGDERAAFARQAGPGAVWRGLRADRFSERAFFNDLDF